LRTLARSTGLLVLLPLALAVAFSACGGGDDNGGQAEQVIERFLEFGQEAGTEIQVLLDELPPDLPDGLPQYPGSSLIGSTVTTSEYVDAFSVLWDSGDSLDEILLYYEEALEQDPWQVVLSTSTADFAALQFNKVDDANFVGGVVIQRSGDDKEHSAILLSVQTLLEGGGTEPEPFELGASKPLPRGFPTQMPVYPQATVTDTGWARSPGNVDIQINFLTADAPRDVIDFYRSELKNKGWEVTDETTEDLSLALSFENNVDSETWSGGITANLFEEDPDYTRASLWLRISSETAENPSATPTP
jgi:hypothetical protein